MKLAVCANIYDCPYFDNWKKGIASQIDMDFIIIYTLLESINITLKQVVEDYDAVLFLDIDDIPEQALVHIAKINAKEYDVTAFAMKLVNEQNEEFGRFGKEVDLSEYNIYGFGNTVWRSDALRKLLPIDLNDKPIDWQLANKAYSEGFSMHFERLPLIRYRQYGKNSRLVDMGDAYVWG